MNLRWVIGVPLGVFGVGIYVGYAARKRGVPPEQASRWLMKEVTRTALNACDAVSDLVPDEEPVLLADALRAPAEALLRTRREVPA